MPFVYVLTNPAMPGLVKLGQTQESTNTRIAQLYTTGLPFPFTLEFACRVENPAEVERALHTAFAPNRVNPRREFFRIEPGQAIAILRLLHTEDATAAVAAEPVGSNEKELTADEAAGEQFRRTRRPNLNFHEMGILDGSILSSTVNEGQEVTVTGAKKVKLGDDEMSLTAATRIVLGLEYSVAPGPYWMFQERLLQKIYDATYPGDE